MPHSYMSSNGSDHGTVTASTLDSFDPERDGATVSSQLDGEYSQKLPNLNTTANKYNRWTKRPTTDYVVNTSAIGRVFPNYSSSGSSSDDNTGSSGFSLGLGRAPLGQHLQQQRQSPPKTRSPLSTITNIPGGLDFDVSRPKSPILSNADAFSRAGSFSKRSFADMQPRVDENDSTTNTNTFTRSNKAETYPKRSVAEMQPEVADANDSTTNSNTFTRNSRFTQQQHASPNVSSKRQQPSATYTPSQHPFKLQPAASAIARPAQPSFHQEPAASAAQKPAASTIARPAQPSFHQESAASAIARPAQPSFHQEPAASAAQKSTQPYFNQPTSTTPETTPLSYHQNPTISTTYNPTQASFVLPAAASNSDSATLDNGVPVITKGGHALARRGSRELVQAVSFGPVHAIIIPDDEEKIYLAIELLKSRVMRGEAENEELKTLFDELRESHDRLAASDSALKQSLDSLHRSHIRLEHHTKTLELENCALKEQNAGLKEQNQGLEHAITDIQEQNSGLEEHNQKLEHAITDVHEQNAGLEQQNQGLEHAITDIREQLEHASAVNVIRNHPSVPKEIPAVASAPIHGNASPSRDIQNQHQHRNHRAASVVGSTLTRKGFSPSKDVQNEHQYRKKSAASVAGSTLAREVFSPSKDVQNEHQYQKKSAASVAASGPLHEKVSAPRSVQSQHQHQEPLAPSVRTGENVSTRDTQNQYQHRKQSAHSVTEEQHQKHPVLSASARHVLDSLCSEHNAKDCLLCTRVTSFGDKTTGGAPIRSANPVPVSKRMPVATAYEDEPTIRPSVEPGLALTTVIKGLEDEIAHLKMKQSEVQTQYQNLDASMAKRERRRIGKKLESLLQQLEFKGDQLYGLYDVLEGMQ